MEFENVTDIVLCKEEAIGDVTDFDSRNDLIQITNLIVAITYQVVLPIDQLNQFARYRISNYYQNNPNAFY